jgi:hypothetical protein
MRVSIALLLALGTLCPATGMAATKFPEQKAKLERQLKAQYVPTTLRADGAFGTPGTVLVLRMPALGAVPGNAIAYYTNNLKGGRLTHPTLANIFFPIDTIRTFGPEEQFYVMNFEARDDAVFVFLFSCNAFGSMPYKADVQFPFPKGYLANVTLSEVQTAIGEVFEVAPQVTAPAPPSSEEMVQQPAQAAQPVEPEHPAQPAEPVTIKMGDSTDQVVSSMGQPDRIAKVASREIYFYKDMKITFLSGKVSDIQ